MASGESRRVAVRSYRGVVDEVERRIFRVDRWRLPTPHGVSVRAVGYVFACVLALLILSGFPLIGAPLGLLPDSVRLVALPLLGGWALASLRIDGRPPHRGLAAALRWCLSPRKLAGLRPCPALGDWIAPVEAIQIAPSGDESRLRAGRVRGPAQLTLRYPARVEVVGSGGGGPGPRARIAGARRVRVLGPERRVRALSVARTLRVPPGREVELR
jgi:hypothetical protein